jgi:nucleoside-diphosphate-sugar epimerase
VGPDARTVAVTGADGFIGRNLTKMLSDAGWTVRPLTRAHVGEIGPDTQWKALVEGCDAVVHLAGLAHVQAPDRDQNDALYMRINRDGTRRLGHEAAAAGVRRLIFISTSKVNGEGDERPYLPSDPPQPSEAYARSKWEAEQNLSQIASSTGLEVVILRPPLIFGPEVKANFLRLMQLVDRGLPLPLGGVRNRRSVLFVDNLGDLIVRCLDHPQARNRMFFAADAAPLSTPDLLRKIGVALDRPARLPAVPPSLLRLGGALLNRRMEMDRLLGSFVLDTSTTESELGWSPPYSTDSGLKATAGWYRSLAE